MWTGIAFGVFYLVCVAYFLIVNAAGAYYPNLNPLGALGDVMAIIALIPFLALGYLSGSVIGLVIGVIVGLVVYVFVGVCIAGIVTYRPNKKQKEDTSQTPSTLL